MEWTSLASVMLSAAALIAVMWQIARAEGMQPAKGNMLGRTVIDKTPEHIDMLIAFRGAGPSTLHEVDVVLWGCKFIGEAPETRPAFNADSEQIPAYIRIPRGTRAYAGITFLTFSPIMRRPVRQCYRRLLESEEPHWETWKWAWFARFWGRPEHGRGHWKKHEKRFARNRIEFPPESVPQTEVITEPQTLNALRSRIVEVLAQSAPELLHDYLAPDDHGDPAAMPCAQTQACEPDQSAE